MVPGQTAADCSQESPQTDSPVPPSHLLLLLPLLSYDGGGHPHPGPGAHPVQDVDGVQVELQAGGHVLSQLQLPGLGRGGEGEGESWGAGGVTEEAGCVETGGRQVVLTPGLQGAGELNIH